MMELKQYVVTKRNYYIIMNLIHTHATKPPVKGRDQIMHASEGVVRICTLT